MRTRPLKFDDDKIPAWTYDGSEPSIYTFTSGNRASRNQQTIRPGWYRNDIFQDFIQ